MWQRLNSRLLGAFHRHQLCQRKIATLQRRRLPAVGNGSRGFRQSSGGPGDGRPRFQSTKVVRPPWHRWEEHWSPAKVEEGLRKGEVLIGRLHVPSFQTDTAFVVSKLKEEEVWIPVTGFAGRNRALHGDEVAALPLWSPWRPGGSTEPTEESVRSSAPEAPAIPPPPPIRALSEVPELAQLAQFREVVLSHLRASEEQALPLTMLGNLEEVQHLRKGLGGLRKALQRLEDLELLEEGQPPECIARLKTPVAPPAPPPSSQGVTTAPRADVVHEGEQNLSRARCRVVAVTKRSPQNVGEIVAVAKEIEGGTPLKAQPKDRRLPALWLLHPERSSSFTPSAASDKMQRDERREASRVAATMARQQSLSPAALTKALQESQKGVLCVVKFKDWPDESLSPRADLVEILGPSGTAKAEADALLAFFNLEWRAFPEAVEEDLRSQFPDAAAVVNSELGPFRRDLRHLNCVTIDPPHAKDLDDAVSVGPGKAPGSLRVGVHIADVTHFLRPGTVTDLEARKRATTVYLVSRTYPMLPRWLSENLCSLLPDGDRLAFSVFFTINRDGHLDDSEPPEMCRAVIRTRGKLNYDMVDRFLNSNETGPIPPELHEDLRSLAHMTAVRRRRRTEQGAMVLERSSAAFELDENGRVLGVVRESSSSASHQLIEELMVLANHVVADTLKEAGAADTKDEAASEAAVKHPLLRCHPDTEDEVKSALLELLPQELQHRAPMDQPLQSLLLWCSEELLPVKFEAVCDSVLKAFKEAQYLVAEDNSEDLKHWALSLPSYMHFTSPIRRYADVLVHRRLAHILEKEKSEKPVQSQQAFLDTLKSAVEVCNTKKRDAQDAQMEEIQIVLSDYVHRSGGVEVDDAVITRILVPLTREPASKEGQPLSFRDRVSKRTFKEAIEIYVPLAQTSRSLSLEVLNLEPLEFPDPPPNEKAEKTSGEANALENATAGAAKKKSREVQSLRVRVGSTGEEMTLQKLQRLHVRLTAQDASSESRHWTIRLPWAEAEQAPPGDLIPPPPAPFPPVPPPPPVPRSEAHAAL